MLVCARCGNENTEDSRFCNRCGTAIERARGGVSEERKVVTVLFADVTGSSGLGVPPVGRRRELELLTTTEPQTRSTASASRSREASATRSRSSTPSTQPLGRRSRSATTGR